MEIKKTISTIFLILSVAACLFAEGGSESTSVDRNAAFSRVANPDVTGESFATVLESRGITENALGTQKWNRIQAQIKDTSWPWPFLPVYPGATITLTPNGIREYSSYSNSYYTIFDENDMEMLLYNPEYLAPLNTGYRKVDGNGFLEEYDKENIRTVLESQAVKINEDRNIISMGFNTPAMFKVVKELAPGSDPEITILSLFPKNNYNNNFGRPFDLGVVVIPYSKVVEMEQEQTSRLYAPWISNQITVTDGRGIEYSSYAITTGDNTFRAGVRNLTTTSRRYSMSLDIDTDCEGLQLVASDKESVTTSSSEINNRFTLRYYGNQTGTAILTLKIVDETEGILYTYSKEYVVEPTQNRDFLTLSDIQAATNGNTKLGALANTNVYLDASLEAVSVEDRCTNVLVQVFDSAGNRLLSSKVGLGTGSKSLKGTLSDGWGATNAFSRLNSYLDFTPSQAGTYTVYVYAFDDSGFLLGKWNTRISVQ